MIQALEVKALGGRPGIYSARYCAGSDAGGRAKLLKELEDVPEQDRAAVFVCAMAVCVPTGQTIFNSRRDGKVLLALKKKA